MDPISEVDRERMRQSVVETLQASGQYTERAQVEETAKSFELKIYSEAKSAADYFSRISKRLSKIKAALSAPAPEAAPVPSPAQIPVSNPAPQHPPTVTSSENQSHVSDQDVQHDDIHWFAKNRQSLAKMLEKRAALENLQIDGVDTRELMARLHNLLHSDTTQAQDIVYVRKYIHIAITYLRKRSQAASASKAREAAAVSRHEPVAAPPTPVAKTEPTDFAATTAYLSRLVERSESSVALWAEVKNDINSPVAPSKQSTVYTIARHLALLHDRLQCLCDVIARIPKGIPRLSKTITKENVANELGRRSVFTSESFRRFTGGSTTEADIFKGQVIVAQCRAPSVLANCISRANDAIRMFNRIPGSVVTIGRCSSADSVVLWERKDVVNMNKIFSAPRKVDHRSNTDELSNKWCHRMVLSLSGLVSLSKQLFSETVSSAVVSEAASSSSVEEDATPDAGLNYLRYYSSTSSLSTRGRDQEEEPCVKRRRINDSTESVFFSHFGPADQSWHLLSDSVGIGWLDLAIGQLTVGDVRYKAFPNANNNNILCGLIVNLKKGPSESVVHVSCDSSGLPVRVRCYRRGGSISSSCDLLVDDYPTYAVLLAEIACGRSRSGSSAPDPEARTQSAISDLIKGWISCVSTA